jgi:hypothetical protein
LASIRSGIHGAPIDKELLKATMDMIKSNGVDKIILRSSTNAEDIYGFSGAGLYTSVPLSVAEIDDQKLEHAMKTVWASVWLPRAYLERVRFRIDSVKVAMSILVQPYYDSHSIAANGVAITANPLQRPKYGVFVTTFAGGEHRATDGVTEIQPGVSSTLEGKLFSLVLTAYLFFSFFFFFEEQSMVHMSRVPGKFEVELISPLRGPGIDSNQPACETKFLEELGGYCARLHKQILGQPVAESYAYSNAAVDVEWLLLKETGQLLVIQARSCTFKSSMY